MSTTHKVVMLVDDNEIDNIINEKMLQSSGYAEIVYSYTSAKGALEFLQNLTKLPQRKDLIPSTIFLDIDMPLMDGFQFLEELKSIPEQALSETKIIMLSSSFNPKDVTDAKKHPKVSDYINKPLSEEAIKKLS